MRLFVKIFICATFVVSFALLLSGYLFITLSHLIAVEREVERTVNQFQQERFALQRDIRTSETGFLMDRSFFRDRLAAANRYGSTDFGMAVYAAYAFFADVDVPPQMIHNELQPEAILSFVDNITSYSYTPVMHIQTVGDAAYIVVYGMVTQNDFTYYMIIANDISYIMTVRELMTRNFLFIYIFALLLCMAVIAAFSGFLVKPVNKMNKSAAKIAKGQYSERLYISGGDEIGELSTSFNLMAEAIEEKIHELSENVRQKEDFVANFAHELKTPLTSVIGYADMIYQKNLSHDHIKQSAWYIRNEGLRLESLSIKLMELIVLNRHDFVLEDVNTTELFDNISGSLKPMLKNVSLRVNAQLACIKVEYDLFKTLLFNLIDNAIKAGAQIIEICGSIGENSYNISISDNGRGMPMSELSRITEAFYTIDKSRSRKQHGAGIGLSLAARIAEIHGSKLTFDSQENIGTVAMVTVGVHNYKGSDING